MSLAENRNQQQDTNPPSPDEVEARLKEKMIAGGLQIETPVIDPNKLTGPQKAATLLLALGPDHGRAIWENLSDKDVQILSKTTANLGKINLEMVERALASFVADLTISGALLGSYEMTEELLLKFLPKDRVRLIIETVRRKTGGNMWEKLTLIPPNVLATYIQNEYPQTAAVILSKIAPEQAACVLPLLKEEMAMDVIQRMLTLESIQKDVLENIEQTLRVEFMASLNHDSEDDVFETMANIFNFFDRQTEAQFMARLDMVDKNSAEQIKNLMFTFEDLKMLEKTAIQKILRDVEKDVIALALKGASDELTDYMISNMSQRAGAMMRDDMENMGPVRLKDVDEAQAKVITAAKTLADKGEIIISKNGGDDEYIV